MIAPTATALLFLQILSATVAWVPQTITRSTATPSSSCDNRKNIVLGCASSSSDASTAASASASTTTMAEIIGNGRIGALLAEAGDCVVLGRDDKIDPTKTGPILIATRNDALEGIVQACPENRKGDLVFLQNGYLDNFLESQDLLKEEMDITQALLFFSVTAKGVAPVDGITEVNPLGLTACTGVHAQALADRLQELGLKCNVVSSPAAYRAQMFEKLIWISTLMLVGTAKECASVGQAQAQYTDIVEQVITELKTAVIQKQEEINNELQFPPEDGSGATTIERLKAYTNVVTDFPCAVKEFEWRNQYFYNLGTCPTHDALLRECASKGLLGFELLPRE